MTVPRLLAGSALFPAGLLGVALVVGAARDHPTIELLAAWLIPLPLTAAGFVVLWPRTGDGRGGPVMQFARWLALALGISVAMLSVSAVLILLILALRLN